MINDIPDVVEENISIDLSKEWGLRGFGYMSERRHDKNLFICP